MKRKQVVLNEAAWSSKREKMQVAIDDGRQQKEDTVYLPQLTSCGSEEIPGPHVQCVLPMASCSKDKFQPEAPPQSLAELAPVLSCGSAPTDIAESSSVGTNDLTVSDCQAVCCNNMSEVYQPKQIRFC